MTDQKPSVLIVGALSDIARAMAGEYAARGYAIQLAARSSERLERIAQDIKVRHNADVTIHECDVTATYLQDGFIDSLPQLPTVVVCAVGLLGDQDADAMDDARAHLIIDTNFFGPARLIEKLAVRMAEQKKPATIVGIGSVAGDRGRAKNYVYGSGKAGFEAYLSGLRQKYSKSTLHIMTVKPGFVRTAMTAGMETPAPLTTDAADFAKRVVIAQRSGKLVYYDLRWRIVMGIIRHVPETIFKNMKF